ncbi:sensor histidine kinase [Pseudooctadecabacter jejudonensis]|uniref:sensor histidine kinase n=1 Tax=Pseudooctadecabacter jejudonensis TaxID=1391910 RepID=UPI0013564BFF|nr:ATP-binding protein [Pseudooctadecabacter jejudonensis]
MADRPRATNTLGSTVFQHILRSSAAFVLVSLAILWAICWAMIWRIDAAQVARIEAEVEYAQEVYYSRGEEDLIEEAIGDDEDVIWSDDLIFELLENGDLLWVLRADDYTPKAGFDGLHGEEGWEVVTLEHPEITTPVRVNTVVLRGWDRLSIGAFVDPARENTLSFAIFATLAMLLIVLPLSLITGFAVSKRVFRRIEDISDTTAAVAAGEMEVRAPQSGRHDEFDRLAGGLNTMLDEVERLTANIEGVSVGVAHDLRTPLSNIGGRLELIRRDSADPQAVAAHVDAAEAAQGQLMRVFDALLRLGEVRAGKRRVAFAPFDLSASIDQLCEAYAPAFEDADKTFTAQIAGGITLDGDRELIEQAVSNLLENALEHSRDAARVQVRLTRDAGHVTLVVGDDGPGISPVHRDRIFERFFRADASRSTPGNGLGLSLVQAIVQLHGAEVRLAEQGAGAEFIVVFQG